MENLGGAGKPESSKHFNAEIAAFAPLWSVIFGKRGLVFNSLTFSCYLAIIFKKPQKCCTSCGISAASFYQHILVPVVGLEPTRCRHQRILSPSRLPIPSHWPVDTGLLYWEVGAKFKSFFSRPDAVPLRTQEDPPGPGGYGCCTRSSGRRPHWQRPDCRCRYPSSR